MKSAAMKRRFSSLRWSRSQTNCYPPTASLGASVCASTTNVGVKHPCPKPSLKALTLEYLDCAKKEELLAKIDEEELLSVHGIAGKISRVCSHIFSSSKPPLPGPVRICPLKLADSQPLIPLFMSYLISSKHQKH